MRSVFIKSLLIGIFLLMLMSISDYSQLVDRKPGKVFEIEGLITCRNFKNTHSDKLGVNVSVRSKSSRIEILGLFMNNMAVKKEGADQYRTVFNFPNMMPGRSITMKIAYKDKNIYPPVNKMYTIARVKLDYFITYKYPKFNSTITVNPGSTPSTNMRRTIFRWSSTRTPYGADVSIFDPSDGSEYRKESNVNALPIPPGLLKKNKKYRIHNYVNLGFIKLQPMVTSSSYLQFEYWYGQYFFTK